MSQSGPPFDFSNYAKATNKPSQAVVLFKGHGNWQKVDDKQSVWLPSQLPPQSQLPAPVSYYPPPDPNSSGASVVIGFIGVIAAIVTGVFAIQNNWISARATVEAAHIAADALIESKKIEGAVEVAQIKAASDERIEEREAAKEITIAKLKAANEIKVAEINNGASKSSPTSSNVNVALISSRREMRVDSYSRVNFHLGANKTYSIYVASGHVTLYQDGAKRYDLSEGYSVNITSTTGVSQWAIASSAQTAIVDFD